MPRPIAFTFMSKSNDTRFGATVSPWKLATLTAFPSAIATPARLKYVASVNPVVAIVKNVFPDALHSPAIVLRPFRSVVDSEIVTVLPFGDPHVLSVRLYFLPTVAVA